MPQSNNKKTDQKSNSSSNSDDNHNPSRNGELVIHPEARTIDPRSALQQPYPPPVPASLDPKAVLNAIRRRWFSALTLGLLFGIGGGFAAWFLVPAPYTAHRELFIKSVPERILFETSEPMTDFGTYKNTHIRRLKSPLVLGNAIATLEADNETKYLIRDIRNTKTIRPQDWLEEKLEVTSPAVEFIRISLSGDEPKGLAEIVNAVTESYLKWVVNPEKEEREARLKNLKDILGVQNAKLADLRGKLEKAATGFNTPNPKTLVLKQQMNIEYFGQLRKQLILVRVDLSMAKSQLPVDEFKSEQSMEKAESQNADSEKNGDPQNEFSKFDQSIIDRLIEQHPKFIGAAQQLKRKEAMLALYKNVAENNPRRLEIIDEIKTQNADLEKLRKELRGEVIDGLKLQEEEQRGFSDIALKQKIATLEGLKESLEKDILAQKENDLKINQTTFELEYLQEDIAQEEIITARISNEILRLAIELDNKTKRIIAFGDAKTPVARDTKKKYMVTAFSGVGLFGFFFAGIVWIELRRGRISGAEEVAVNLNMRVIGSLPCIPRSAIKGAGRRGRTNEWHRKLTDSIDSTRTMLLREADRNSMKLLMVTSALPGEGKTTLCSHLATSLVRAGRKVLLIDGDLRRPGIHDVFENSLTPGLCEQLQEEADLFEVIRTTTQDGLWILPAGIVNEKAYQALAQGGVKKIFEEVKQEFDFIIVDSAPILPVTDSLMIAQHADAVLFSIRRDVSQATKVAAAMDRMEKLGVPVLGSVVIGMGNEMYGSAYPYASYGSSR